jgi:DNA-binding MarR family transcriptional regulator
VSDVSRYDHTEIDDVIHGRLRLGVMAYLSTVSPAPFVELKAKVNATDGNLSTHLTKLEEAGYVRIEKKFEAKKPLTLVHLTKQGRAAWIEYLGRLQALLKAAE